MQFVDHGRDYIVIRAADSTRGGMILRLLAARESRTVAEIFYADATGEFSISVFEHDLPLTVIERLISAARFALLPETRAHGL